MSDADKKVLPDKRLKKILLSCVGVVLSVFVLLAVSLKIYLTTPDAASRLSTLLTDFMHQQVTVQTLTSSGSTIYLKGISIADSPGFTGGTLLKAESIAIAPHWSRLLLGRRDFRLINLEGVQIELRKNSAGVWNFSGISRLFDKPATGGGGELLVGQLSIRSSSVSVNDRGVRDISFSIRDLATRGFRDSRIELTFADDAHNRYTLNGTGRGGSDSAFELALRAPELSLAPLTGELKLKNSDYLKQARGDIQMTASLHKGLLKAHGELGFSRIAAGERMAPLSGRLLFDASYHQESDQARLEGLDLAVGSLLHLHGAGRVNGLKKERMFELDMKLDDLDLQRLEALLPAGQGKQIALAGTFGSTSLHFAGSASQGKTAVTGGARLREFSLTQDGRIWISGLCGTVSVARQGDGLAVKGDLSDCGSGTRAALESIRAPFELVLSSRLKLQKAALNSFQARFMGLRLDGRARYAFAAAEPFSASLQGSSGDLAVLNPLLKPSGIQLKSGNSSLVLQASGKGPRDFNSVADLKFSGLHGSRGQNELSLKQGTAAARISRRAGRLSVSGSSDLRDLSTAGKSGQARLNYRLVDNLLTLENSTFSWDNSIIALARLTAVVPVGEQRQGTLYYPLAIDLSGVDVLHRAAAARGISGRLSGFLASDGKSNWLEGTAELAGGRISWQGKRAAAPLARVTFSRSGAQATITGSLLGGVVSGTAAFNPFSVPEGAAFNLAVKGVDLASTAGFLPLKSAASLTEGQLDASITGRFSGAAGLNARIEAAGKGISAAGNGKSLVSRAGITLSGDIADQRISIRSAQVSTAEGVSLSADGELENAFSTGRRGSLNYTVPQAPLNSFIDAFINTMPRFLQEATVDGSLAASGTLALRDGHRLLQGALQFRKVRLNSPDQSMKMEDLDGSLPFSLDLAGTTTVVMPKTAEFSRDNFKLLRQQLSRESKEGQVVTIGRIALGKLELGALTMHVKAANGLTEIASLRSSLYEGTLLGTGSLMMKKGVNFRGDLLISGLSLTEVCSRIPGIKGYISGRINGIVSLSGEGGGISGLNGFTELWANEAKGEKMLVSREFLQRLGGRKLSGIFFRKDLPYDRAEISALLEQGYLTFDTLDIMHTNIFGVHDLNVSIAPSQNRIAIDHLMESIKQAAASGKAATDKGVSPEGAAPATEFKWQE